MSDEFGNDFITITDDDGNEFELEHVDSLELNGALYMAFLPTDIDEDDEDYGLIVLKTESEGDEEFFISIDDEDELKQVFDIFIQRLADDDED